MIIYIFYQSRWTTECYGFVCVRATDRHVNRLQQPTPKTGQTIKHFKPFLPSRFQFTAPQQPTPFLIQLMSARLTDMLIASIKQIKKGPNNSDQIQKKHFKPFWPFRFQNFF